MIIAACASSNMISLCSPQTQLPCKAGNTRDHGQVLFLAGLYMWNGSVGASSLRKKRMGEMIHDSARISVAADIDVFLAWP